MLAPLVRTRWIDLIRLSMLLGVWVAGCQSSDPPTGHIRLINTPGIQGGESRLYAAGNENLYLSWTEYINDSITELRFCLMEAGEWGPDQMIVSGSDWFTNWADFPSLVQYIDQHDRLAVHWLAYRGEGTYEYDINIRQSMDAGQSWLPTLIPHRDGTKSEHGFVSMIPLSSDRLFITWLDGRNTVVGSNSHGHGSHDAMGLRAAEIDRSNEILQEWELDAKVCDCCQTDAALTPSGPVVVYRDRSEEEIRDIYITRSVGGRWTVPQAVYHDQWKIGGCPVNGPAVATYNQWLAVAWYTEANDTAQVKLVISQNEGRTFLEPVIVDEGLPLGRVDIVFLPDGSEVLVTWIEGEHEEAHIRGRVISVSGEKKASIPIHPISPGRSSGFPQLEVFRGRCYISWTQVEPEKQKIQTAEIQL